MVCVLIEMHNMQFHRTDNLSSSLNIIGALAENVTTMDKFVGNVLVFNDRDIFRFDGNSQNIKTMWWTESVSEDSRWVLAVRSDQIKVSTICNYGWQISVKVGNDVGELRTWTMVAKSPILLTAGYIRHSYAKIDHSYYVSPVKRWLKLLEPVMIA